MGPLLLTDAALGPMHVVCMAANGNSVGLNILRAGYLSFMVAVSGLWMWARCSPVCCVCLSPLSM